MPKIYVHNQKMLHLCSSALHSKKDFTFLKMQHNTQENTNSELSSNHQMLFLTSALDCKAQSVRFTPA